MNLKGKKLNTLKQINNLIEELSREEILSKEEYIGKNTYDDFSLKQKQLFNNLYDTIKNNQTLLYFYLENEPIQITTYKNGIIQFENNNIYNRNDIKENRRFLSFINKNNNFIIEFEFITKKESSLSRTRYVSQNIKRDNFFDTFEEFLDIEHTELIIYIEKIKVLNYHSYKTIKDNNTFIEKYGNMDEIELEKITDIYSVINKHLCDGNKKIDFLSKLVCEYNTYYDLIEINYWKNSPIYIQFAPSHITTYQNKVEDYGLTPNKKIDIYNMMEWIDELTENTISDIYQKLTTRQLKKRTLIKRNE